MVCSVYLPAEDRTVAVENHQLEPIAPGKGEQFKVIMGEDRDYTGIVLSIDGGRAVCSINNETVYKPLKELALITT